jgi:hypothetical protein
LFGKRCLESPRSFILLLIAILTPIGALLVGAWSYRPVVEYRFTNYPETFDSSLNPLNVTLGIKNTGKIYVMLYLALSAVNGTITSAKNFDQVTMSNNGSQLRIRYELQSDMNAFDEHVVYITPENHTNLFGLTLTIDQIPDSSIPNGVISRFLESHSPVAYLEYEFKNNATYELATTI